MNVELFRGPGHIKLLLKIHIQRRVVTGLPLLVMLPEGEQGRVADLFRFKDAGAVGEQILQPVVIEPEIPAGAVFFSAEFQSIESLAEVEPQFPQAGKGAAASCHHQAVSDQIGQGLIELCQFVGAVEGQVQQHGRVALVFHRAGPAPPLLHLGDQIGGIEIPLQPVLREKQHHQIGVLFLPAGILHEPVNLPGMGDFSGQTVREEGVQKGLNRGGKLKRPEPLEQNLNQLRQPFQDQLSAVRMPGGIRGHDQAAAVSAAETEVVQEIIPVIVEFKYAAASLQIPEMRVGDNVVDRVQIDLPRVGKKSVGGIRLVL